MGTTSNSGLRAPHRTGVRTLASELPPGGTSPPSPAAAGRAEELHAAPRASCSVFLRRRKRCEGGASSLSAVANRDRPPCVCCLSFFKSQVFSQQPPTTLSLCAELPRGFNTKARNTGTHGTRLVLVLRELGRAHPSSTLCVRLGQTVGTGPRVPRELASQTFRRCRRAAGQGPLQGGLGSRICISTLTSRPLCPEGQRRRWGELCTLGTRPSGPRGTEDGSRELFHVLFKSADLHEPNPAVGERGVPVTLVPVFLIDCLEELLLQALQTTDIHTWERCDSHPASRPPRPAPGSADDYEEPLS